MLGALVSPLVLAMAATAGYAQWSGDDVGRIAKTALTRTVDAPWLDALVAIVPGPGDDRNRGSTAGTPVSGVVPTSVPARPSDEVGRWVGYAVGALAEIRVEPEFRRGYDRSDWPHWSDDDGDCMDARHETLAAQSARQVRTDRHGCRVTAGVWFGPYTGQVFTDPTDLDVDHVVPLQEAHDSGGHSWSTERRRAFANDLAFGRSLMAVEAAANRSKGAKGPEEWLPPSEDHLCVYVADWTLVKHRWGLSMDERERVTVGNVLAACSTGA